MLENIVNILQSESFWTYIVTLFGSAAMYVFTLQKGFAGAVKFLKKMFPDKSELFYDRSDFFLVVVFGSVIGFIFFNPNGPLEALAAGFGWVGAMNTLLATNMEKQ